MVEELGENGVKISPKEIYDMVTKVNENVIILTQEFKSEFKNVNEKISQLKSENIASDKKDERLEERVIKLETNQAKNDGKIAVVWYFISGIILSVVGLFFKNFGG